MNTARAARLGKAAQVHLFEQNACLLCDQANRRELDAGAGVEIDSKLVRMIEVGSLHRVRMELHAAEIDDPHEPGSRIDHHLVGRATGGKRKRHGSEIRRQVRRRTLLVKGLSFSSVDESLEHDRPALNAVEGARRDREKITDQVKLGELCLLREVELVRMRDANGVTVDLEQLGVIRLRHRHSLHLQPVANPLAPRTNGRLAVGSR